MLDSPRYHVSYELTTLLLKFLTMDGKADDGSEFNLPESVGYCESIILET